MNRRTLLLRASPLASLACLAGCLGSSDREVPGDRTVRATTETPSGTTRSGRTTTGSGGTATESRTTTDRETTTTESEPTTNSGDADDFSGVDPDADGPFQSLAVGSRDDVAFPDNNRPRDVRVWNDADEAREITVTVSRDAKVLLDRTVAFDPDAYLAVALNEPADYRVAVGLAGETPTTFRVGLRSFDCNATTTDVGVAPDGSVETNTASTLLGCHGPKVAATDLSVGEGECGTANRASVAFDGEQVRVDGTVRTPTPGADLELADASYDSETMTLTVRIRATGGDGGLGVQCVGTVPYEAAVDFEYDLPGEVVVVHESPEETAEVV